MTNNFFISMEDVVKSTASPITNLLGNAWLSASPHPRSLEPQDPHMCRQRGTEYNRILYMTVTSIVQAYLRPSGHSFYCPLAHLLLPQFLLSTCIIYCCHSFYCPLVLSIVFTTYVTTCITYCCHMFCYPLGLSNVATISIIHFYIIHCHQNFNRPLNYLL